MAEMGRKCDLPRVKLIGTCKPESMSTKSRIHKEEVVSFLVMFRKICHNVTRQKETYPAMWWPLLSFNPGSTFHWW
jgi:hypothetical protein